MTSGIVVVASAGLGIDGHQQVEHLVRELRAQHRSVDLLVVGGTETLTPASRSSWIDVDELNTTRLRTGLRLLRSEFGPEPDPSRRLSRLLDRRCHLPWIFCDPNALTLLDHLRTRPPKVIVHLADPGARPDPSNESPRLDDVDLWLAMTPRQTELLTGSAPIEVLGSLARTDATGLDHPRHSDEDPVVVSTAPHRWEAVDHMVEVVDRLLRRCADTPLLVLADPGEDEWLAAHDLAHLGLGDRSTVRVQARQPLGELRPRFIVRTGYVASDADLVLAAARAGIPTVGFELGDLPGLESGVVAPFAVDELVDLAVSLLDPLTRRAESRSYAAMAQQLRGPHQRLTDVIGQL